MELRAAKFIVSVAKVSSPRKTWLLCRLHLHLNKGNITIILEEAFTFITTCYYLPYSTSPQAPYLSVGTPSSSIWPSSKTCTAQQSKADPSTSIKYVRNPRSSSDINVFVIHCSVHRFAINLNIPITTSLHSPLPTMSFRTMTSSRDQCFSRSLSFPIIYL